MAGSSAEYYREYRKRNAERRREIERQYRERNADAVKAKNARHREATKEHRAEYDRRWAAANREKSVAKTMRWRAKNPAYHVEAVRRYNLRKRGASVVPFTLEQLAQRLSMFTGCWMCGGPADTIDHVKPLNKGGAHMLANLRPACRSCNSSKSDRWPLAA